MTRHVFPGDRRPLPEEYGELARMVGKGRDECPYPEPLFARAWERGWDREEARMTTGNHKRPAENGR